MNKNTNIKRPKVSIIMPTYNVEKYFRQCIESIINQTLIDIEIIPVDDGSPDNCGLIMDEYAAKDNRIKPIHQSNGGYGKAVNSGLKAATGEYIGIVETDDWCEPDMYEKLYKQAKKFNTDVCKCGFNTYNSTLPINEQSKKWKNYAEDIERIPSDRTFTIKDEPNLFMIHASIWANLYKKDFLDQNNIKVNETKSASYQDFPFMAEVMCKASRIGVIHDYLYHWRLEPNQQSSTKCNNQKLLIMIEQCERVKEIVKDNGLYDILKSQMYRHFASANLAFFKEINTQYRKEYFDKCCHLFNEIKNDKNISYQYCTKGEHKFIKAVVNNKYWQNYGFTFLRKVLFSIHWNKREKKIILFGKELINLNK